MGLEFRQDRSAHGRLHRSQQDGHLSGGDYGIQIAVREDCRGFVVINSVEEYHGGLCEYSTEGIFWND